jgi:hypothetical protein
VSTVWLDQLTDAALRAKIQGPDDTRGIGGYLGAYAEWRVAPCDKTARTNWFTALEDVTGWLWDVLMGPLTEALAACRT